MRPFDDYFGQGKDIPHGRRADHAFSLDQRRLARLVGYVAAGLPLIMLYASAVGWPFARSCPYDSISHYYYARFFGDVFVGSLSFIGVFLIAYTGEGKRENRLASAAGVCAFGVALFPTSGAGCENPDRLGRIFADLPLGADDIGGANDERFYQLFAGVDWVHLGSAGLLFAFLAFYSFVIFTREIEGRHRDESGALTHKKRLRNRIYDISGWTIVICIGAITLKSAFLRDAKWWTDYNLTFLCEALALVAFGTAWMVKGRVLGGYFRDPEERAKS